MGSHHSHGDYGRGWHWQQGDRDLTLRPFFRRRKDFRNVLTGDFLAGLANGTKDGGEKRKIEQALSQLLIASRVTV